MSKTTLDSLGTAGFGMDFDALHDKMSEVYQAYEGILESFVNPLMLFQRFRKLPISANRKFNSHKENFWKWAKIAIDEKRTACESNPDRVTDLLDAMIASHFIESDDGYQLSDNELLQNISCSF